MNPIEVIGIYADRVYANMNKGASVGYVVKTERLIPADRLMAGVSENARSKEIADKLYAKTVGVSLNRKPGEDKFFEDAEAFYVSDINAFSVKVFVSVVPKHKDSSI